MSWLGEALSRLGFQVTLIAGGPIVVGEIARAFERVSAEDSLLVHVSGHLARRGVLRLGQGQWLALRVIADALARQKPPNVSLLAEFVHPDDSEDAFVGAEHVASVVSSFEGRERGYGVVAAVRPSTPEHPVALAFTRLLLEVAATLPAGDRLLSKVYERATAMPESLAAAQSFTFVKGRSELDLAPPPLEAAEIDALIAQATDARAWPRVIEIRREKLGTLTGPNARVRELIAIARILQVELGDGGGAIDTLEEARAVDPTHVGVLQALRRGYARHRRWASASEVVGALAVLATSNVERAGLRFGQARIALEYLEDEERAVQWLEAALKEDPDHEHARALLAQIQVPEVVASAPEPVVHPEPEPVVHPEPEPVTFPHQPSPVEHVASLAPLQLGVLGAAIDETPALPPAESALGIQLLRPSDPPFASFEVVASTGDVLDPATHVEAFDAHRDAGRTDAAFMAALALEELGVANVDQQLYVEQFRSLAPVRPRGSMDGSAWALLRAPGSDDVLEAMFRAVSRAAIVARLEQLVARGMMVELDPERRLEPSSTASIVRSFDWAARVLGVRCPHLFVVENVPGEIAAVRAHQPSTAVGPSVVRGRSAKDLAFLAGRHLTYYRPEYQVLVYFPTREELTRLFLATLQLTMPGVSNAVGSRAVGALCERLERHITPQELRAVAEAVIRLDARGGQANLGAWTRAVELTGARAGLLLCGDLATAASVVRSESREIAALSIDAKLRELIAFTTSEAHLSLRELLAVGAQSNLPVLPPPNALRAAPQVH